MKKICGIFLAAIMLLTCLAGCSSKKEDWDYIEAKKELIVGITMFAPMNYKGSDGELTGFETEFARAVCETLGVNAKFQEVDWGAKTTELNSKNIDCLWNGMTIDDERRETMDISNSYMQNKQIMVTKTENAGKYTTPESVKDAKLVAEVKSAGEAVATTDEFFKAAKYTSLDTQATALLEVKAGTADIAIIDYVMSIGSIGTGTDYSDLSVIEEKEFAPEEYGIAFRKNSPVTLEKVNAAIQTLADNGTLSTIAEKYKLQNLLLIKPTEK